jgi:hypothetical protein
MAQTGILFCYSSIILKTAVKADETGADVQKPKGLLDRCAVLRPATAVFRIIKKYCPNGA